MENVAKPFKEFYSVEEIIARLGIGRTLAYKLISAGEIKSIKVGVRRLVPAEAFDAYIERLKNEAA